MLKFEPRGAESPFWRYAAPVLALLLTGVTAGLIFAVMGRPPGRTVYTLLVAPLLQQDGLEALVVKAAPLIIIALVPLALRGVAYQAGKAEALLARNLLIYGLGGVIAPFVGIKLIDLTIHSLGLA